MSPLHVFIRKLIMIIPTVLLLSFLSFSVIYFAPGSAEKLLLNAKNARGFISDKTVDVYGKKLGLNKPFGRLYAHWLCSLLKGYLGTSYLTNKPVSGIFIKRFSVTFKLALLSLLIYSALGIPIGVLASVKENILCRFFLQRWRIICMSIPSFWIAVILVWFIANYIPVIPTIGYHGIKSLIVPAFLLGIMSFSNLTCVIQSKTQAVLSKSFIILAGALGIPQKIIFIRHVLKNIAAPAIAVACIDFSGFIGGAILIENIFSIPGLGLMLAEALNVKDYPVIAGTLFLLGLFINLLNFFAEMVYLIIDRRGIYEN